MIPQDAGLPDPGSQLPTAYRDPSPIAGRIDPIPSPAPHHAGPSGGPPGLSAAPDIWGLLQALRRRWISAILLGGTLATLAGIGVWNLLTPKATGFARVRVAFEVPNVGFDGKSWGNGDFRTQLLTTAAELTSRGVINAALRRPEVKNLNAFDLANTEAAAQAIEEDVKTEVKENTELITVMYSHSDPTVATVVANAIKEAYVGDVDHSRRTAKAARVTLLEQTHGTAVDALKNKKTQLKAMIERDPGKLDPRIHTIKVMEAANALRDLRTQQNNIEFKYIEAVAALEAFDLRMKAWKDRPADTTEVVEQSADVDELLERDPEAKQIRDRIKGLEELYDDFARKGGANRPTALTALKRIEDQKEQLAKRRVALATTVRKIRTTGPTRMAGEDPKIFRAQLRRTVEQYADLKKKVAEEVERQVVAVNQPLTLSAEYDALQNAIALDEKLVTELGAKVERERLELRAAPRITSAQDAELMKKDIKKQLLATGVIPFAVFGSVCFGLAWYDFRQRRIRKASQVSNGLGIRVVGAVPDMPGLERRLVGPTGECDLEGHPVLESIDAIRTHLLHAADSSGARVVMVTSAVGGEGKTTLAAHLAGSLARAGRRTLLIDGDLRRPSVHELFEATVQPGFAEVLLTEVEWTDAVVETPLENLSIMPAGQWDREVLLALSRDGLQGVLEKLSEEFDFLVIDSHPVLAATDALLIGRQADAVILSVLREVSQMPRVYAAAQKLQGVGIHVLGAVVNATDPEEMFTTPPATVSVS